MASLKAIAVAGLSAIALAASGCGGDSDREAELSAAFEKEFQYGTVHITGINVKDGGLVLRTDLAPKSDFDAVGAFCGAAYRFAIEKEAIHHEGWVHVKDRDGHGILSCA